LSDVFANKVVANPDEQFNAISCIEWNWCCPKFHEHAVKGQLARSGDYTSVGGF
jgi:hypothetical protein